ncbi:MAG: fumarylacetoacetate hydrolase family protein, partial [Candidatus Thermoplasmatota archaeon]|nr:fumarylacetoacetate hydrolase family protein [Candidatus Thermoplasmatota archaeon]
LLEASGFPLEEITRVAPVTCPPSIRDFYAFEEHVRRARSRRGLEVAKAWYDVPVFYFTNPAAVFGPHQGVPKPASTQKLDFELEVAWILGKEACSIPPEAAFDHIAGLTIMNDWSARDIQAHEMQVGLGPSKGKDFATSLGPDLVTLDELEPYRDGEHLDLTMTARINGETVSEGNLADLHWTIPQMTAHASRDTRLSPGDVLGTGTVGTGSILDLGTEAWLEPGDTVELEVEHLGTLTNQVAPPG